MVWADKTAQILNDTLFFKTPQSDKKSCVRGYNLGLHIKMIRLYQIVYHALRRDVHLTHKGAFSYNWYLWFTLK